MNLSKHDPQTDMENNMTSMIDVVFLLIIFFMIITDMTQQDLEELKLPIAVEAVEDKPAPDEVRPIVNLLWTGTMVVKREEIYVPEKNGEDFKELEGYLADQSQKMIQRRRLLGEEAEVSEKIPDGPLLVRADENTPFHFIQKIMESCGKKGIQIWKVQLAAAQPEDDGQ